MVTDVGKNSSSRKKAGGEMVEGDPVTSKVKI